MPETNPTPKRLRWERQSYVPQYSERRRERQVAVTPAGTYTVEQYGDGSWDAALHSGNTTEVLWTWATEAAAKDQCEARHESLLARLNQHGPVELVEVAS